VGGIRSKKERKEKKKIDRYSYYKEDEFAEVCGYRGREGRELSDMYTDSSSISAFFLCVRPDYIHLL